MITTDILNYFASDEDQEKDPNNAQQNEGDALLNANDEDNMLQMALSKSLALKKILLHFSSEMFHYSSITPKRVTSSRSPSSRHCARATQLPRNIAAMTSR